MCLEKPQKKSSSPNGRAINGGGGGKVPAIKEKKTFFTYFLILLPFKDKNYFTFDNLSKYGHITLKFVVCTWLLQYFPKYRAIF